MGEAVAQAARNGVPAESWRAAVPPMLLLEPVFTAHPTEARRRTVLEKLRRLAGMAEALDDPRVSPREDAVAREGLREEITALWLTEEVHRRAPGVFDEVANGLYYFETTLWDVVPRLYRDLESALAARLSRRALGRCRRSCASGPGSAATGTAIPTSRPPSPSRRSASTGRRPWHSTSATSSGSSST